MHRWYWPVLHLFANSLQHSWLLIYMCYLNYLWINWIPYWLLHWLCALVFYCYRTITRNTTQSSQMDYFTVSVRQQSGHGLTHPRSVNQGIDSGCDLRTRVFFGAQWVLGRIQFLVIIGLRPLAPVVACQVVLSKHGSLLLQGQKEVSLLLLLTLISSISECKTCF